MSWYVLHLGRGTVTLLCRLTVDLERLSRFAGITLRTLTAGGNGRGMVVKGSTAIVFTQGTD
jgi:hypothetical protein